MKSTIAMAGVALALESEQRNAARIRELERQLEQQAEQHAEQLRQAAQRERSYRDQVATLLTHIEDVVDETSWGKIDTALWNAVTAPATTDTPPGGSHDAQ
jgi:hypothetical protein